MLWARYPLALLLLLLSAGVPAESGSKPPGDAGVQGMVFLDANGNGARDAAEPGIGGVAVSNQIDVTASAPDGSYRLPAAGTGIVFVSLPDGYGAQGAFWQRPRKGRADFALVARPIVADFTFIHASDPHTSRESLPRLDRLREQVGERKPAFVIMSGDLVKDALRVGEAVARGYYDLYAGAAALFPVPVWNVPGNHEIFGIERHLSLVSPRHELYGKAMYRAYFGPTYYSFTYGGVHFVGLDTVDVDDLWYYGHVDQAQLDWLRADLALVPLSTPIVTFNHIPFLTSAESINGYDDEGPAPSLIRIAGRPQYRHVVSNLVEVRAVLSAHRWTLALAGHMHRYEAIRFDAGIGTRFYQAAAIAGPNDGPLPAQSGFTVYRVSGGAVDDGTFVPLP
jgi:Calcineurin-like phosphoesterase